MIPWTDLMNDPYPQVFQIAIERDKLCRYLRAKAFLSWVPVFLIMGTFLGFAAVVGKHNQHNIDTISDF